LIAELAHGLASHPLAAVALRDARADFARAGDEREDVGASGNAANVDLLKSRGVSSSDRKKECWRAAMKDSAGSGKWRTSRFSRRIPARAPGKFDRVRFSSRPGRRVSRSIPFVYISIARRGKMVSRLPKRRLKPGHEVVLIPDRSCRSTAGGGGHSNFTSDQCSSRCSGKFATRHSGDVALRSRLQAGQVFKSKIKKNAARTFLSSLFRHATFFVASEDRQYLVVGLPRKRKTSKPMRKKNFVKKNCDIVVANDVSRADSGMEAIERS